MRQLAINDVYRALRASFTVMETAGRLYILDCTFDEIAIAARAFGDDMISRGDGR